MIKQLWLMGMYAAIGAGTVSFATAQVPQETPDPIVVTGCVQRAAQLPVATSGAVGDVGLPMGKFVLTKATKVGDTRPDAMPRTYRLDADDSTLSIHVGQQVQVTGTLESAAPVVETAGDPAPPPASDTRLKVASVKMVAATCPE